MEFEEQLCLFISKIPRLKSRIQAEEGTKNSLILPLFDIMGYDTRDPFEVNPEYTADFGTKQKEKVDYAICINDKPVILVEAKPYNMNLNTKNCSQLYRYFSVSEARIGILTNGLKYMFFSDLVESNKMDKKPFFEIDLEGELSDSDIAQLKKFRKEEFDVDKIAPTAMKMKNQNELYDIITKEMADPSEDLIRVLAGTIHEGKFNKNAFDKYKPLIITAFEQIKRDAIGDAVNKINNSITAENQKTKEEMIKEEPEIVTTEQEIMGFNIVRAIGSQLVPVERITIRDARTYCAVFFDDNNRKPICNMYFDSNKKYVEIPDETGKKVKYPVESEYDIYKHQDKIISVINKYLKA